MSLRRLAALVPPPRGNLVRYFGVFCFCLAVSAINGCGSCIRSHEREVIEGGLTQDQLNDAVRIAGTFHGAAVALEM